VLNEGQIKTAVIDRLFASGALDDAVLINEMVIANWSRRVDLAVANGHLNAFEIKSDLDTLRRLPGQLSAYLDRFDKVTIVTTQRFARIVSDMVEDRVEIWEASEIPGGVALKVFQRGRSVDVTSRNVLCGFLHKPEIATHLVAQKISANSEMPRETLIKLAESTSVRSLRKFVLSSLKSRYKHTFEHFRDARDSQTKITDLNKLSKARLKLATPLAISKPVSIVEMKLGGNIRRIDLVALEKKYGPLPDAMPDIILRRQSPTLK
jgi:hypothetical protein